MVGGRRPSVEDDIWWKALSVEDTFGGRWPSVEDNLHWKKTFGGRWPSMEDDLQWKTTFSGRRPSVEDDLQLKTTFSGIWHLVEYNLRWKTTFGGRRLLVKDNPCMLPSPLCGIFWTKQSTHTQKANGKIYEMNKAWKFANQMGNCRLWLKRLWI